MSICSILLLQYLASLRACKPTSDLKGKAKGKGKIPLMNLDLDEEEVDASVVLEEEESECLKRLEKSLGQCAKCGVEKRCKIDKLSTHVHLSFQQLRSWALSLVTYTFFYVHRSLLLTLFIGCWTTQCYPYFASQNHPFHQLPWSHLFNS
jgi:hypothetical protein